MEFSPRKAESWLMGILAIACALLAYQNCSTSEADIHDSAYRIQEAYYKLWNTDSEKLAHVTDLKDLINVLRNAGYDIPKSSRWVILAPNTGITNGTAVFLALPKQNRYAMAIPPSIRLLSPTNHEDYALGETIHLAARITDSQCQVIKVDVKVNGEEAGALPCVDNEVSGSWKPDSVGTKTVTVTAYNEFGLTATATAGNITVHENHPPTVTIPLIADGMTLGVGSAYKLDVSAEDPDQTDAITDVNLVIDGKIVSTQTQPPYSFQLGPLDSGIYMVQATAHDQHGALGDSYIYKVYVK